MVKRDVKGIAKVTAKGRVYWYAWRERGAPKIHGEYGTADFSGLVRGSDSRAACPGAG